MRQGKHEFEVFRSSIEDLEIEKNLPNPANLPLRKIIQVYTGATEGMHFKATIGVFTIMSMSVIAQITFGVLFLYDFLEDAPLLLTFEFTMGIWAIVNMVMLMAGIILRLAD